jgi:hypothetical protein
VFQENTEYKESSSPMKTNTPNSRVSARERKPITSRLPAAVSKPVAAPELLDEPEEPEPEADDQDVNEPTYCICDRVSYGEMIGNLV